MARFLILFAAFCLGGSLQAQPVSQAGIHQTSRHHLLSSLDIPMPPGLDYVLGLHLASAPASLAESVLSLSTTSEVYSLTIARPFFVKVLRSDDWVEGIEETSSVISDPVHPDTAFLYSTFFAFAPAVVSVAIAPPNRIVAHPIPDTTVRGLLAGDSFGALYVYCPDGSGIRKFEYQNSNFTSPVFTTATSGPGAVTNASRGFAVARGVIYLLDPARQTVFRYDANTGKHLGHFGVTGAKGASAIAVSDFGRLYLTTGNGGGNIYRAPTGAPLGTFAARANANAATYQGIDGIVIDNLNGIFYAADVATGVHVFHDPALHVHY